LSFYLVIYWIKYYVCIIPDAQHVLCAMQTKLE